MDTLANELSESVSASSLPPVRPYHVNTGWTEDRTAMLRTLWADGLSASQIAGELGGVTRSGVLGKVHRLDLAGRIASSGTRRSRKSRAPGTTRKRAPKLIAEGPQVLPLPAEDPSVIPLAQRKTILELENHHCHFPYGDPGNADFFYCGAAGADTRGGRPYCPGHQAIAYTPVPDRRRQERIFNTAGMPR